MSNDSTLEEMLEIPEFLLLKNQPRSPAEDINPLRVIKTARDEKSINQAAAEGFFPLLKRVEPSEKIRSKFAVLQHPQTGAIQVTGDLRARNRAPEYDMALDFTFFYPHSFPSPFAAYLIPADLAVGEAVFLEDLIEDHVKSSWNQGDVYRLASCKAIWNGQDFEVQHTPAEYDTMIG